MSSPWPTACPGHGDAAATGSPAANWRCPVLHCSMRLALAIATLVAFIATGHPEVLAQLLHREAGFHRFFLGMSLFIAGMLLIVLAGNVALTFVGWELAGRQFVDADRLCLRSPHRHAQCAARLRHQPHRRCRLHSRHFACVHLARHRGMAGTAACQPAAARSPPVCSRSVSWWRRWPNRRRCRSRPGSPARWKARPPPRPFSTAR